MFKETVPQFIKMLQNLDAMMVKTAAYADTKKFDVNNLTTFRLAPDMLPFVKQIQIACDTAKFTAAYLTGQTAPKMEDNETTWTELRARIQKTVAYLQTMNPEQFSGAATAKCAPGWAKGKWMPGQEYVIEASLPNFYFHVAAAYMILRNNGIDIGKNDFLGAMNFRD